jgi:hypothetical protein
VIFGRRITRHTDAGLKTQVLDHDLGQAVIRSEYKSSSIKQYARDNLVLRTETTSYHTPDTSTCSRMCWRRSWTVVSWSA